MQLTVQDVSKLLGVTEGTVTRWIKRRGLPAQYVGGQYRFHRAELLDMQMELGVTTARRGWVESRHVVNTRPVNEIRAMIAAKRKG